MIEETVGYYKDFNRDRLKRIFILKSDQGNFCLRILTLDRDTLRSRKAEIYLTPKTLGVVVKMGMAAVGVDGLVSMAGY